MALDIDTFLVVSFILLNLVIGVCYSKRITSVSDYALGGRHFDTSSLVATTVATTIGGGFFAGAITESYRQGLYFIIPALGEPISLILVSIFLIPRMKEFLGDISIAESMGKIFGKKVQLVCAIFGIFLCAGIIALQFKVLSSIFSLFFGVSGFYGALAGALVVITYSTLGGIRAVTFTDVIQFFTFGTIIPIVSLLIWKTLGDTDQVFKTIASTPNFDFSSVFDATNPDFRKSVFLLLFFLVPGFQPVFFQRITMATDIAQAKKVFLIAGVISTAILLVTSLLGLLILSDNTNLDPDSLLPYIIDEYSYTGLKGLLAVGVISIVMSTADSYINSASAMFTNDVFKLASKGTKNLEIIITRGFAFFVGTIALILAVKSTSILNLILFILGCYMPVVSVPLVFAILGFRSSGKSVLMGMLGGGITTISWNIWMSYTNIDSVIPGIFGNIIILFASHYILRQSGGWEKVVKEQVAGDFNFNIDIISNIKSFRFTEFCRRNTPRAETTYSFFGFFCIIAVFSTMYSLPQSIRDQHDMILEFIDASVLLIATMLITYPIWPPTLRSKTLISILWITGLFYTVPFVGTLQVIISDFGQFPLMVMLLSTVILSTLVSWQAAISIMILGVLAGFQCYKSLHGMGLVDTNIGTLQFKIMYLLLLFSSILIAFLKPKQEYIEKTEAKVDDLTNEVSNLNEAVSHYTERVEDQAKEIERLGSTAKRILNNVNHELRLPVGNVVNFATMLNEGLDKLDEDSLKELSKEVYDNSNRLSSMILNMLDLATLNADKIELEKKVINFSELVRERINTCLRIYVNDKQTNISAKIEENILVNLDPNYIRQTVDNLIINAISFGGNAPISISVLKASGYVEFVIQDKGIGIPESELYDIFTPFKMGSNCESKAEGRGVGLALCKAAIDAHGGRIRAESKGRQGAKFVFSLKALDS